MDMRKQDEEFITRFQEHEEELRQDYLDLYHGDLAAFGHFAQMLETMYKSRPEALRLLDAERLSDSRWYKGHELVGMLMYVKAFAGTLQGVREKLDYIEACGINYLHLMPLLESPKDRSDGGYAVSDFRTAGAWHDGRPGLPGGRLPQARHCPLP